MVEPNGIGKKNVWKKDALIVTKVIKSRYINRCSRWKLVQKSKLKCQLYWLDIPIKNIQNDLIIILEIFFSKFEKKDKFTMQTIWLNYVVKFIFIYKSTNIRIDYRSRLDFLLN